jgi:uncharacterized protein (DUF58 family)
LKSLADAIDRRFRRWAAQRTPLAREVTLNRKCIYILPTRSGYLFLMTALGVFLAAVNYENSLAYLVCFLMCGLFVVSILHTYNNLSGLTIQAVQGGAGHVDDDIPFRVRLQDPSGQGHESLELFWPHNLVTRLNRMEQGEQLLTLFHKGTARGYLRPERLCIQTTFPLGLMRSWTWVHLDFRALVYPRPLACQLPPAGAVTQDTGDAMATEGVEDFTGFRRFQPGDSLQHIAWKKLSRSEQLLTKDFSAYSDTRWWLDYQSMPAELPEEKLSQLCFWCLRCEQLQQDYGLRLPGVTVPLSRGPQQLKRCLQALAMV